MDVSLMDALLGLALAYSATYVLYCWIHGDARRADTARHRTETSESWSPAESRGNTHSA